MELRAFVLSQDQGLSPGTHMASNNNPYKGAKYKLESKPGVVVQETETEE